METIVRIAVQPHNTFVRVVYHIAIKGLQFCMSNPQFDLGNIGLLWLRFYLRIMNFFYETSFWNLQVWYVAVKKSQNHMR